MALKSVRNAGPVFSQTFGYLSINLWPKTIRTYSSHRWPIVGDVVTCKMIYLLRRACWSGKEVTRVSLFGAIFCAISSPFGEIFAPCGGRHHHHLSVYLYTLSTSSVRKFFHVLRSQKLLITSSVGIRTGGVTPSRPLMRQ